MTIRKRLFLSNLFMIFLPAAAAVLAGAVCLGFLWFSLLHGAVFGAGDSEDFVRAAEGVAEAVEQALPGGDLAAVEPLLASCGLSMTVLAEGTPVYRYGAEEAGDAALLRAAAALDGTVLIRQNGRGLYARPETAGGRTYTVCLFGGQPPAGRFTLEEVLGLCAALIASAILGAVLLTNRFLTRFVLRKIEEPLTVLAHGVRQIENGNLDYRIDYREPDEFAPVCADFNRMAGRLKASVARSQREEVSRKELLAGISHDIRSPLTAIQAYVEGLLDGVAQTPEAQRRYLTTIKARAEQLESMVSQLFLFSKLELGEAPGDARPLDAAACIAETVEALRAEYLAKGLAVKTDLVPCPVRADPVQLGRVVTNILQNSLKYKNRPVGNAAVTLRPAGEVCRLTVADDGPGVPEAALPRLFDVFYRTDAARQNPRQGSGLGLAIVAGLVKGMGGRVTAANGPAGGLVIEIELPLYRGETNGKDSDC